MSRPLFVGVAMVLAVTGIAARLHTDTAYVKPPHTGRPVAVNTTLPPSGDWVGDTTDIAVTVAWIDQEEQREREAARLAAEAERLATIESARVRYVAPSGSGTPPTPAGAAGQSDVFLACTRAHESDTAGGYSAVSPSGTYRGAYQFDARTWAGAVSRAGFEEWAGVPADQVPADVQDAAALQLYSERGNQPWGGRC
jgi:hypothetical protein